MHSYIVKVLRFYVKSGSSPTNLLINAIFNQEEMVARMELQRELEECRSALKRLEVKALYNIHIVESQSSEENAQRDADGSSQPNDEDSSNEQIMRDVKSLRGTAYVVRISPLVVIGTYIYKQLDVPC